MIKNSLGQSHDMVRKVVKAGDTVIDATAGNGNDSVFLAGLVGSEGRVYAFDIQDAALEKTESKLITSGLLERVTLIHDGHQNMDLYIKDRVQAVMFNLGYLPGGDHCIGTKADTTKAAIEKAMKLIKVNGIVAIVVYYGGDSGFDEKEEVMNFIKDINPGKYVVMKTDFPNQINCPPIFICIEKIAE